MEQLSSEVNNYDALVEAMASGSSEQIEAALNQLITGYRSFNEETLASSQSARDEMYNTANSMISTMQLVQRWNITDGRQHVSVAVKSRGLIPSMNSASFREESHRESKI